MRVVRNPCVGTYGPVNRFVATASGFSLSRCPVAPDWVGVVKTVGRVCS